MCLVFKCSVLEPPLYLRFGQTLEFSRFSYPPSCCLLLLKSDQLFFSRWSSNRKDLFTLSCVCRTEARKSTDGTRSQLVSTTSSGIITTCTHNLFRYSIWQFMSNFFLSTGSFGIRISTIPNLH